MKTCFSAVSMGLLMASISAQAATAVHDYKFNGNLLDSIGGIPLTPNGGSLASTPGSYDFQANQGLNFTGEQALGADYSLALRFKFEETGGYRRVVDFKNLSSDTGFYVLNSGWNFYNVTGASGSISPGEMVDVVLTRNSATDEFNLYVNGNSAPVITFTDSSDLSDATSGLNSIFHFFQDDLAVGGEASAGSVDRIIIFDGALTANDLNVFTDGETPVPEPSTWAAGLAGCLLAARTILRRRSV